MDLKIISFNIRCGNDSNGHTIKERAPRLKASLLPLEADLIGFQEYTYKWAPFISKDFEDKYRMYMFYRDPKNLEATPILWKDNDLEALEKNCFWLSDTEDMSGSTYDELGFKRICEYIRFRQKSSGVEFVHMNTHFGFGDENQVKSAKLLIKYASTFNCPVIVTGDFNMIPGSAGYTEMTKCFTDVNSVTAKYSGRTFHEYSEEGNETTHIDYCFVMGNVTPLEYKLIDDRYDGKYLSDHYGLFIKLKI